MVEGACTRLGRGVILETGVGYMREGQGRDVTTCKPLDPVRRSWETIGTPTIQIPPGFCSLSTVSNTVHRLKIPTRKERKMAAWCGPWRGKTFTACWTQQNTHRKCNPTSAHETHRDSLATARSRTIAGDFQHKEENRLMNVPRVAADDRSGSTDRPP